MLHVVTTEAYYPPAVTIWKILTTGASYLTTGTLCNAARNKKKVEEKCEVLPPKLNAAHLEHLCEHGVSAELTREGQACQASVVPDQHQDVLL